MTGLGVRSSSYGSLDKTGLNGVVLPIQTATTTIRTKPSKTHKEREGVVHWSCKFAGRKKVGMLLLFLISAVVFLRVLSKQKPEPVPVEVLAMPPELAARSLQNGTQVTPEMLNELIKQKPVNIGTALRDWVGTPPAASAKN